MADLEPQPRVLLKSKADTDFLTSLLTDVEFVQQEGGKVPIEGSSQPKLWANMQAGVWGHSRHFDDGIALHLWQHNSR